MGIFSFRSGLVAASQDPRSHFFLRDRIHSSKLNHCLSYRTQTAPDGGSIVILRKLSGLGPEGGYQKLIRDSDDLRLFQLFTIWMSVLRTLRKSLGVISVVTRSLLQTVGKASSRLSRGLIFWYPPPGPSPESLRRITMLPPSGAV